MFFVLSLSLPVYVGRLGILVCLTTTQKILGKGQGTGYSLEKACGTVWGLVLEPSAQNGDSEREKRWVSIISVDLSPAG